MLKHCVGTVLRRRLSPSYAAIRGVTEYRLDGDELKLVRYNFTAPLEQEGTEVTSEPDAPAAPR